MFAAPQACFTTPPAWSSQTCACAAEAWRRATVAVKMLEQHPVFSGGNFRERRRALAGPNQRRRKKFAAVVVNQTF